MCYEWEGSVEREIGKDNLPLEAFEKAIRTPTTRNLPKIYIYVKVT